MFRLLPPSMEGHPILGVVLFVIGCVLVGFAYYSPNAPSDAMSFFAFNGVFLVVLGCRKLDRIRRENGRSQ